MRDRRGRGARGPSIVTCSADPLVAGRPRLGQTPAQRFDDLALGIMQDLWDRFPQDLGDVELGVEEVPLLPSIWTADTVPLASFVEQTSTTPARLVLLRRPIEMRAQGPQALAALILTVVVEQLAEALAVPATSLHTGHGD